MSFFKKRIILAGGSGTRMYPLTIAVSKQLLPIYDKPLVYYPLAALMLAGVREVLIITTPVDQEAFQRLLGDGSQFGISIQYAAQAHPNGLAEAFIIGSEFIGNDHVALVLGDNILYGHGLPEMLDVACKREHGATIFAYQVTDPERYGVVEFDATGRAISLVEKPGNPKSRHAIPGLYFYDNRVVEISKNLAPSPGTHESMSQASSFVEAVEQRQGLKICCPEEIAYRLDYISADQLPRQAAGIESGYGEYLRQLVES